MADRFYLNCELTSGTSLKLEGPEAHHLVTVRRFRVGDHVSLFNGNGLEHQATIVELGRREVLLEIGQSSAPVRELDYFLEVAVPLPKGDRAQFLLEKLTELGVTRVVLLKTARSVITPRDAKMEKLQRYVIEASKQCGRNVLMEIGDLVSWENYCVSGEGEVNIIAHPGGASLSSSTYAGGNRFRIAIGPEGGFTDEEVEQGIQMGWQRVDLGARILRMETAAITLAGWISLGKKS